VLEKQLSDMASDAFSHVMGMSENFLIAFVLTTLSPHQEIDTCSGTKLKVKQALTQHMLTSLVPC